MHRREAVADRLLLIHPDTIARDDLMPALEGVGLAVRHAPTLADALRAVREEGPFGVVLLSLVNGPGGQACLLEEDLLPAMQSLVRQAGQAQIIVLTDQSLSMEACCDLVRVGVGGFVDARDGGIDQELLRERVAQARQRFQQAASGMAKLHAIGPAETNNLVWQSPAMADLLAKAARSAQVSDVPILIYGESGTGKQLLAELIHQLDPKRSGKRFLSVNCSAISGTLAESAMFGHVKGAFTGATSSRKGIFRSADGGTVLLDEIGEMEPLLQPKLLRVLQEGVVMPLGSDDEIETDVRVIAATNRRLAALVEEGRFRLDLYQRLDVIALEVPPLRERPEDIPALLQFFLKKYASYYVRPIESVDPRVYDFLTSCTLLGNVRELENAVRQILAFKTSGTELVLGDIPPSMLRQAPSDSSAQQVVLTELVDAACQLVDTGAMTLPELVSVCEKMVLRNSMDKNRVTASDLAKRLGLSRRTLYNKIHKYQLSEPRRMS